jgi:hypothetical protein
MVDGVPPARGAGNQPMRMGHSTAQMAGVKQAQEQAGRRSVRASAQTHLVQAGVDGAFPQRRSYLRPAHRLARAMSPQGPILGMPSRGTGLGPPGTGWVVGASRAVTAKIVIPRALSPRTSAEPRQSKYVKERNGGIALEGAEIRPPNSARMQISGSLCNVTVHMSLRSLSERAWGALGVDFVSRLQHARAPPAGSPAGWVAAANNLLMLFQAYREAALSNKSPLSLSLSL